MLSWKIESFILELKYTWKIARNASDQKTNLVVTVSDGVHEGRGEAAPNVRYGESPEQTEQEFAAFLKARPETISQVSGLTDLLQSVPLSHALRFGIESAFIHFWCAREKISVQEFLGLEVRSSVPISYSIPIMEIGKMKQFYADNRLERFRYIKIKVNAEEMHDAVKHLSEFCGRPLIVDANEAFRDVDHCIRTLEKIRKHRIEFIEQPMPSDLVEQSIYLKKYCPFMLFADESVTDTADFSLLKEMFGGINVKLMKAGGYLNSVRLLKDAKAHGMKTMIGCMVETSLAISSGLNLLALADYADLDSFLVLKREPFGLVKEADGILSPVKKADAAQD